MKTGINPEIYNNPIYKKIQIWYFKSLLEIGAYIKAEEVILKFDFTKPGKTGIIGIKNQDDFNIHYLLANLQHLTNDFTSAINLCQLLLNNCKKAENIIDLKYLIAHCMRHQGDNNDNAIALFKELTDDTNNLKLSPKTYIRACYSIISLEMLKGYSKEKISFNFEQLYNFAKEFKLEAILTPYIQRHEVRYISQYNNDIYIAIKKAEETLKTLEINQLRIKYDFYFELAELYRELYFKTKEEYHAYLSTNYYNQAISFAKVSKDYNLQSTCELGQILLDLSMKKTVDTYRINIIGNNTLEKNLYLNYYSSCFIKCILQNKLISDELLTLFNNLGYNNLYTASLSYNEHSNYYLKLVVM